tara:strand:+ start:339 stop:632 length:294 start_codon:yes stop_codon:yes gene_type:complete
MTKDSFFNIDFEEPTPELELSVELRCREIINNQNIDEVKKHCINLIRHQMKQDIFLAGMLGRIAELEASHAIKEMKDECKKKKTLLHRFKTMLSVFR